MYTPYRGSLTPRFPVKRKLTYTTPRPVKRSKAATYRYLSRKYPKGPSTRGSLYAQVKSLQRAVKAVLPELKQVNVTTNQTNITASGTIQHLSVVQAGTGDGQRIGEDIRVKKISIKGLLGSVAAASAVPTAYRFVLFVDKQQVADTTPTISDLFTSTDPTQAFPNTQSGERFRYLYVSPVITNNMVIYGVWGSLDYTWSGDLKVSYNGTATSDIQKNGIYLLIQTNDPANVVDFSGAAEVYFTDA